MDDIDEVEDCRFVWELTPEETHARLQTVGRVRAAIAQLPVGQRQVVTLVDLEECTYNEVSEILSIPIGTVMSRLCRARQALKTALAGVREEGHKAIRSVK